MDVLPSQSEVFLLADQDRRLTPDGPALVGPDGVRREIPVGVYEAMQFVEAAMLKGFAVQVTALRHELPIDEAAGAIGMSRRDLRAYAAEGAIPFRSTEHTDWVQLEHVLAFSQRLKAQRRSALDEMLNESIYDDDDDFQTGEQDR
ncbi:hypothetical protein GCM10009789_27000 [Kribbella sancticallisti]|uniref:Helix-turn-helix domain-containing protein n=1 Tax=Kribbella sancticallisti TaxID=460087 RepID=A0ABN2D7Q8_9ACTN